MLSLVNACVKGTPSVARHLLEGVCSFSQGCEKFPVIQWPRYDSPSWSMVGAA